MKRVLIVMCVAASLYTGVSMVFAEEPVYTYRTIKVTSGDTMWGIASAYAEPGDDIHEVIFNICQWNNLKSKTLHPGQKLRIRVRATDDVMLAQK